MIDATISYIVTGNTAFSVEDNLQKNVLINARNAHPHKNDIWIGLQLNKEIDTIDKLRFYFDIRNSENRYQLQSILQLSKWTINNNEIKTIKGVVYEGNDENQKRSTVFDEYDVMHVIEQEVQQLYDNQFITLSDKQHKIKVKDNKKVYPEEFNELFSASDLVKFKKEQLWLKISSTTFIDERVMFDLSVALNAFPVVNRFLQNRSHRFKGITNIVPLKTEPGEYFLCVKSLKDLKGKAYVQIPFAQDHVAEIGTYSIRKGGVERFDTRSAREYLNYLIELMRDESAIFSSYGQDTVTGLIKDMERILVQIEQRIKQHQSYLTESHHYITIDGIESQNSVNIEYWITNGELANGIHSGTHLALYEGTEVRLNSMILLSTSNGGKRNIELVRHMDAYRYALLTHNRLVTPEDIKAFCMYELGGKIEYVEIRKSVMRSNNPKEGLVRCIDIVMQKKDGLSEQTSKEDWELLFREVKSKLELRSAINANYRLLLA